MWWNRQKVKKADAIREHIALQIATAIIALQTRAARTLQRWEQRLSQRQKKIVLILFVACCSLYLGAVLVGVLTGDDNPARSIDSGIPPTIIAPPMLLKSDSTAQAEIFKH